MFNRSNIYTTHELYNEKQPSRLLCHAVHAYMLKKPKKPKMKMCLVLDITKPSIT